MKKHFLSILAVFLALTAQAALVTKSVQVTGTPSDGDTITINSVVRTWKNTVTLPSSQIQIGGSLNASATNLYVQIAGNAISGGVHLRMTAADTVSFEGDALALSASGAWATVGTSSLTATDAKFVRVPFDAEPNLGMATNIASLLVSGMSDKATNTFAAGAVALSNHVNLAAAQIVSGNKSFTGSSNYIAGARLVSPSLTNAVNYGNAFSSPGTNTDAEQFGKSAIAGGANSTALGKSALASGTSSTAIGNNAHATGDYSTALGTVADAEGLNSVALGLDATALLDGTVALGKNAVASDTNSIAIGFNAATTRTNQVMLGNSGVEIHTPGTLLVESGAQFGGPITSATFNNTNRFPAGADISFGRYALSSLANGNNAGIVVGTNVFVEVSGPTGAFTVNGIAGGRDGKLLILLNQTGQNMTIAHDSGTDPTAGNRIFTMTGADRATTGNGAAILIYSGNSSRWILVSLDQ